MKTRGRIYNLASKKKLLKANNGQIRKNSEQIGNQILIEIEDYKKLM